VEKGLKKFGVTVSKPVLALIAIIFVCIIPIQSILRFKAPLSNHSV
jgi:hypothetical protein